MGACCRACTSHLPQNPGACAMAAAPFLPSNVDKDGAGWSGLSVRSTLKKNTPRIWNRRTVLQAAVNHLTCTLSSGDRSCRGPAGCRTHRASLNSHLVNGRSLQQRRGDLPEKGLPCRGNLSLRGIRWDFGVPVHVHAYILHWRKLWPGRLELRFRRSAKVITIPYAVGYQSMVDTRNASKKWRPKRRRVQLY